jgi:phage shock protein A
MLDLFKRLLKIGKTEVGKKLEKAEDPVLLIEQQIKELKTALAESLRSLAEVKAAHIRSKRETEHQLALGNEYERKAILLLQKAQFGEIDPKQADLLAAQALSRKEEIEKRVAANSKNLSNYEAMVQKLEGNAMQLRSQIDSWEQELRALKARAKVSEATRKLNEQMAGLDINGTVSLMNRLQENVEQQEALVESYNTVIGNQNSLDVEIDKILGGSFSPNVTSKLDELKNNLKLSESTVNMPVDNKNSEQINDKTLSEIEKLKEQLKKK